MTGPDRPTYLVHAALDHPRTPREQEGYPDDVRNAARVIFSLTRMAGRTGSGKPPRSPHTVPSLHGAPGLPPPALPARLAVTKR